MEHKIYIYTHWNTYAKTFDFDVQGYKSSLDNGYYLLEEVTISFETPTEKELKVLIIGALRKKVAKIYSDAGEEASRVEAEIGELLALEYKPEVGVQVDDTGN